MFLNLLETLKRVLDWHTAMGRPDRVIAIPKNVDFMIRQMVMPHYIAFQYSFREADYGRGTQEDHFAHLTKYLSKIRILFDEEAETDIQNEDHDSGAWYLELQSGRIERY